MKKVLFLDIDGVLNTERHIVKIHDDWVADGSKGKWCGGYDEDGHGHVFDPGAVEQLGRIVDETGCYIVISSSWRGSGMQAMKRLWKVRDMPGRIIGLTPIFARHFTGACRGDEIMSWLDDNEVDAYAVVDDNNGMGGWHSQEFVRTDSHDGITEEVANKIIQILNA